MNTVDTTTDIYILTNKDGDAYGSFEVEEGFDILKLKDMTLIDAIIFLDKEGVYYKVRTGALGTLTFK